MKTKKTTIVALLSALSLFGLTSCPEEDGGLEEVGEDMDEAVEDAGEGLEDVGDEIGD